MESITEYAGRLDTRRGRLYLKNGNHLKASDVTLLRQYLRNLPRRNMARHHCVTVKAIEKRLKRIKGELGHENCACRDLHGCLSYHDLIPFLLAPVDWFKPDQK